MDRLACYRRCVGPVGSSLDRRLTNGCESQDGARTQLSQAAAACARPHARVVGDEICDALKLANAATLAGMR
eukprot:142344-Pyramimonas_sp.AAC.1